MPKVDPDLRQEWKDGENRTFSLILRVTGDLEARAEVLEEIGCQVRRRFRLTSSISVRCTGETALALTRRSWVTKVERDSALRVFGG
ncbi:MAG: hypothetical protein ACOX2L_03600 [Anaerolineae bacterium]|jgi:hypothetical protein|nr:hypothetical protein [Chloroflexota bacterium]